MRHFETELLGEGPDDGAGQRERWVLSYADFITLMFAFFVVMYSISSVNDGKFRVLSQTMLDVFQNPEVVAAVEHRMLERAATSVEQKRAGLGNDDDAFDAETMADPTNLQPEQLGEVLVTLLAQPISTQAVRVRTSDDWTEIEFATDFAFKPDSMELDGPALKAIDEIAELARAIDMPIRVEGFTDNVPQSGGVYRSNRQLSAGYAASVADALVDAGVRGEQVSAAGFGELHPQVANASAKGRERNRRIVVAVARHDDVGAVTASIPATRIEPEQLPTRTLGRVTELPGPESIRL